MAGLGMIFDETYRPVFEQLHAEALYRRDFGPVEVRLAAVASRTGSRAERYRETPPAVGPFVSCRPRRRRRKCWPRASTSFASPRRTTGISTPPAGPRRRQARPDRKAVGAALAGTGRADALARQNGVLAKVVYHKLADPDHKKLRTHVVDGVLRHVNNGYCSLAGAEIDQRQAVRRVDRRPQSGNLRRRPLHQADRLHVRRPARRQARWPASPRPASAASSARRTAPPGTPCSCRWSTPTPTAARRRSTFTPAG